MKHGKKYVESTKLVEHAKLYEANEALELACKTATAKFDETVECHVRLGVDSRHADQQVRGAKATRLLFNCTVWASNGNSWYSRIFLKVRME